MTNTTQGNVTLAEFLSWHKCYDGRLEQWSRPEDLNTDAISGELHSEEWLLELRFHSDWNWLHEAWEKFRDLKADNSYEHLRRSLHLMSLMTLGSKSDAFTALVESVEWWNSINEKTE